jgi:hypothetical protein
MANSIAVIIFYHENDETTTSCQQLAISNWQLAVSQSP